MTTNEATTAPPPGCTCPDYAGTHQFTCPASLLGDAASVLERLLDDREDDVAWHDAVGTLRMLRDATRAA